MEGGQRELKVGVGVSTWAQVEDTASSRAPWRVEHGIQVRLAEGRRAKAGKFNVKWSQAMCLIPCQSVQMTD